MVPRRAIEIPIPFDDHSEVPYRGTQRLSWYVRLLLVKPGDTFYNEWVTRFDPLRALFSFKWQDRNTGKLRPLNLKIMVFMTPETATTTRFHVFHFLKYDKPVIHNDKLLRSIYLADPLQKESDEIQTLSAPAKHFAGSHT